MFTIQQLFCSTHCSNVSLIFTDNFPQFIALEYHWLKCVSEDRIHMKGLLFFILEPFVFLCFYTVNICLYSMNILIKHN